MAGIFGPQTPGPTRINQVQINQSVLGYPLPVVMGKGKIQQSLLWVDGFVANLINTQSGGKGFGGGKGGNQYVYSADVIAALCDGPITGIADVWSGQSWLSNNSTAETYVITGGTPSYTPVNAGTMTANQGVGITSGYGGSYSDLGGGTPTVLSGTHMVPVQFVPYGTTVNAGQYTVNPATNTYYFSPADVGLTVTINYSFALGTIKKQQLDVIPSGLNVVVGGTIPFSVDGGVNYYLTGDALTAVSGTPTVTGTYSIDPGSYTVTGSPGSYVVVVNRAASYTFAPGDENVEVLITYELNNTSALPAGTSTSLDFSVFEGNPGQSPLALLLSNFPGAALGYSGIAYVAYSPMDLGYGAQIQQNIFEVLTADAWGGAIVDCNPVQCILRVLTDEVWGLGAGAVPFPVTAIDAGSGGTWGNPIPKAAIVDSTAAAWFAANGFFISPVLDRQDTAASIMGRWLDAGQCAMFMSEGLLKLVPYGDTSTAGNGATWVAPSNFVVALDDTCFIPKGEGQDPVKITSSPWQDAYNTVQVSWNNRQNQYAPEITPESDQAAINRYGSRIEDPQSWDFITSLPSATFAASMRVKRNVYQRNTYEFTVPFRYTYLEPMDIVPITTSSVWAAGLNNENLAIVNRPVRITKIVDNPDGTLDITAEDYVFGANQPTIYNKQLAAGEVQPNEFADPGVTEVVVFEATSRLTGFQGNQIWIGGVGSSANWGGFNVFASMDSVTYKQINPQLIGSPARLGTLGASLPSGSDPDTTNSLVVDLVDNSLPLESGTTADADQDNTLCYVDGELVSYSTAAASGIDQYTAGTYLRRGQMGSAIASHASGTEFMRLDDAVFKFTFDPTWYGKTVYLKFQSVNVHGNSAQPLSSLTAVTLAITGSGPGAIDPVSGYLTSTYLPPNIAINAANNCTLATAWIDFTSLASVTGYGPGGPGTDWVFTNGQGTTTSYPSFTMTGLFADTPYMILYDITNGTYTAVDTTLSGFVANLLSDYFILLGTVTTASVSSAGTPGGGAVVHGRPISELGS